ncbi:riboflavin biosynthesis protein RibC [Paenibacillus baekrokdamisoli]|uniref:Riboflavin biosynthesis protein n=1 Tax=Paenibacillus baekrokdamisoli TaxID=1712516 RepID=A0A3G9IXD0_9BACL|nr:bifunctional riboflavin kinase/FAD synthetase [Paenibacillus baekrokdamisoli]MBB3069821.1 riboflavin kinase/FMN adenylyltransferase [Paenibacillus baekrokdamisoli]BBH20825.1 riboflavin biosynthesis protein RibC [Paenibacillus baekrokdamisoli]
MEIIFLEHPVHSSSAALTAVPKTVAIGHFDGVHRGHQNVIQRSIAAAKAEGLQSSVMTFHPHPKEVLGQGSQYVTCLTPLEEKVQRFLRLGVDVVYIVKFDLGFSVVTPPEFVDDVLRPLQVKKAIVGFDFTFGSRGAGKASTLRSLGEPDIRVEVVEPLKQDGEKVSSTLIRESLAEGRPEVASQLLGAPYEVHGTVIHGEGRGRTIGFPTANIELEAAYVQPKQGVYAIMAEIEGKLIAGVLNLGVKPTFHEQLPKPVLEAHLFDFDGDIYGKSIAIQFISFLRSERKFGSIDELIHQIQSDAEQARAVLAAYNK